MIHNGFESEYDPQVGDVWQDRKGRVVKVIKVDRPSLWIEYRTGRTEWRNIRRFCHWFKFIAPERA
jgi:hypothetical protein